MKYADIVNAVQTYSDRSDVTTEQFDTYLRIVESKINRTLKIADQSESHTFVLDSDDDIIEYPMPDDFAGVRFVNAGGAPLNFRTPDQQARGLVGYGIVGNTIVLTGVTDDVVMQYYAKVSPITSTDDETWLSLSNPDVYIFGVMVEVSAFVKETGAFTLWEGRFNTALAEALADDQLTRWSGSPMQIEVK